MAMLVFFDKQHSVDWCERYSGYQVRCRLPQYIIMFVVDPRIIEVDFAEFYRPRSTCTLAGGQKCIFISLYSLMKQEQPNSSDYAVLGNHSTVA